VITRYLLDTNICILIMRERPLVARPAIDPLPIGTAAMSVVTLGELRAGAERSVHPAGAHALVDALLATIPALDTTTEVARHYGQIRAHLAANGQIIGSNDLWTGAHALALGVTLVTSNLREFARIPDLRVEDWAAPDVP